MDNETLRRTYILSTDKRELVNSSIAAFQQYVNSYKYSTCEGNEEVFISDMLYMLGVSISPNKYSFLKGFSNFKKKLKSYLNNSSSVKFTFGEK